MKKSFKNGDLIELYLSDVDGNAFYIMGEFRNAAKKQNFDADEVEEVLKEATNGDYDHLLQTIKKYSQIKHSITQVRNAFTTNHEECVCVTVFSDGVALLSQYSNSGVCHELLSKCHELLSKCDAVKRFEEVYAKHCKADPSSDDCPAILSVDTQYIEEHQSLASNYTTTAEFLFEKFNMEVKSETPSDKPKIREMIERLLKEQKKVPCYVSDKSAAEAIIEAGCGGKRKIAFITAVVSDEYRDDSGISWKYALPFDVDTGSVIMKVP